MPLEIVLLYKSPGVIQRGGPSLEGWQNPSKTNKNWQNLIFSDLQFLKSSALLLTPNLPSFFSSLHTSKFPAFWLGPGMSEPNTVIVFLCWFQPNWKQEILKFSWVILFSGDFQFNFADSWVLRALGKVQRSNQSQELQICRTEIHREGSEFCMPVTSLAIPALSWTRLLQFLLRAEP